MATSRGKNIPGQRRGQRRWSGLLAAAALLLGGCLAAPPAEPPAPTSLPGEPAPWSAGLRLEPVAWEEVEGWLRDDPRPAFEAFLAGCPRLAAKPSWERACREARALDPRDRTALRAFFEGRFTPHRLYDADGGDSGLVTGYYLPELAGSRQPDDRHVHPLYGVPGDLLRIELAEVYPDLGGYRLRGRLEGNRVVPFWSRQEITGDGEPLQGDELFWVEDPLELFLLQVQGSGRIALEGGGTVLVHYADQNGHPYRSIGRVLVEWGELELEEVTMQSIRAWARANPQRLGELLNRNPSYVFFREFPGAGPFPPGAMGVALTPGASLAVDRRHIPLGAPIFLAATWPGTDLPLNRLAVAQDTGGAINGPLRADLFWGAGEAAGELAGRMKEQGRFWLLLPREVE